MGTKLASENNFIIKEKEVIYNPNCSLGGDNDFLLKKLKDSFKKAKKIDIIVSFIRETGVRLLKEDLNLAKKNGASVRVLSGNYLGITEPGALRMLRDILGKECDMRLYTDSKRSFHPKAYIFHYDNGDGEIFIGSSNISNSALTSGIEWNYKLRRSISKDDFDFFCNGFEEIFLNETVILNEEELKKFYDTWKKPSIKRELLNVEDNVTELFEPRGAQIEALSNLEKLREEGIEKALIVAATGIGKTYLSAFDSKKFKKVLFVAHREELLKQAERSFKTIRNFKTGFFNGDIKENNVDGLFASVQTLGKAEFLNEDYFKRDYFDYIVIDEVHHGVNKNYLNILKYFKPKFLLGITATPERMDNKDVFKLFDYNVAFEIRLFEAINKGYLCPFRYYGIYDETVDYSKIASKNGKFNEKELELALMKEKRADIILRHYKKYRSKQALGFCSTKRHAEYMAKYFNDNGIKSCAVYSGTGENSVDREEAIKGLIDGEYKVIFSVDMFNEGVDIKSLDMVMFLRPTESSTIFLQQLGRALRLDKDKDYVNILDFIGNHKKIGMIPSLLGKSGSGKNNGTGEEWELPDDCIVDFDLKSVELLEEFEKKYKKTKDKINEEYFRIKEELGHRPNREEFITYIDSDKYTMVKSYKEKPLKNYLKFLVDINEASEEEKEFLNSEEYNLINCIETTAMSKTYKMPILLAFYNEGNFKMEINSDDIYLSMKKFYENPTNKLDLIDNKGTKEIDSWDKEKFIKKAKDMPLKHLAKTEKDFFDYDEEKVIFKIKDKFGEFENNEMYKENFIDAIRMRVIEYYKNRSK